LVEIIFFYGLASDLALFDFDVLFYELIVDLSLSFREAGSYWL